MSLPPCPPSQELKESLAPGVSRPHRCRNFDDHILDNATLGRLFEVRMIGGLDRFPKDGPVEVPPVRRSNDWKNPQVLNYLTSSPSPQTIFFTPNPTGTPTTTAPTAISHFTTPLASARCSSLIVWPSTRRCSIPSFVDESSEMRWPNEAFPREGLCWALAQELSSMGRRFFVAWRDGVALIERWNWCWRVICLMRARREVEINVEHWRCILGGITPRNMYRSR